MKLVVNGDWCNQTLTLLCFTSVNVSNKLVTYVYFMTIDRNKA